MLLMQLWSDYDILIVLNKRDNKIIDEIYEIVIDFQAVIKRFLSENK